MDVGSEFKSYQAVENALIEFSQKNNVVFYKRDSKTLKSASKTFLKRTCSPSLKYYCVKFACIHGGRQFKSCGSGQRFKPTFRKGCNAHITLKANANGKALKIVSASTDHNHDVSKNLYARDSGELRLLPELCKQAKKRIKEKVETLPNEAAQSYCEVVNAVGIDPELKQGISIVKVRMRPLSTASTNGHQVPDKYTYNTLKVDRPRDWVFHVQFNRPEKRNAMNRNFWMEIGECFKSLDEEPDCRSIVVSGAGKMFSSGLDLQDAAEIFGRLQSDDEDVARKAKLMRAHISEFQQCFTAIEKCSKPVIAAVHGACIGSGLDLICACDIRYCTKDAWFSVKEVDIGLAADIGTLQRLPKIVSNEGVCREWVYTARNVQSEEALQVGLVSKVCSTTDALLVSALDLASLIATKSPVAVQGSKIVMNYSRDHTVQEGLDFVANWNQTMLQSEDVVKAVMGSMSKSDEPTHYSKL